MKMSNKNLFKKAFFKKLVIFRFVKKHKRTIKSRTKAINIKLS